MLIALLLIASILLAASIVLFTAHRFVSRRQSHQRLIGGNGAALVALNLQQAYLHHNAQAQTKHNAALQQLNQQAQLAYREGHCVIFSQQLHRRWYTKFLANLFWHGLAVQGTSGVSLDRRVAATGHIVASETWDLFRCQAFATLMNKHKIKTLYLTGMGNAQSLYVTALSALKAGYEVILLEDAMVIDNPERWQQKRQLLLDAGAKEEKLA